MLLYISYDTMNKTITFLSISAVAVMAWGLLTLTLTNAEEVAPFSNGAGAWFMKQGMHGKFQAVQDAVVANDFAAFQNALAWSPFADKITTEAQFAQLQEMHALMEEGKTDEAKAIAESLGLPLMGMGKGKHGDRQAIKEAIDANDFAAFQTAQADATNGPLAQIDTAEEFAKLVKMHSLLDEAKAIGEELGIQKPFGKKMHGMMKGMMQKAGNSAE
jgi:hypothetical protein